MRKGQTVVITDNSHAKIVGKDGSLWRLKKGHQGRYTVFKFIGPASETTVCHGNECQLGAEVEAPCGTRVFTRMDYLKPVGRILPEGWVYKVKELLFG